MNSAAEQMPGRGHMIKRLNNFILTSLKKVRLRSVGAVLLGGCAGLSLNSTILPLVMSNLGVLDEFSVRWAVGGYAVYIIMVWAVGGWAARKTANPMLGGTILGFVGLVSGALVTGVAVDSGIKALLAGGAAGLVYGSIGGMLIAYTLGGEKQTDTKQ
jgi:hypothetical protein